MMLPMSWQMISGQLFLKIKKKAPDNSMLETMSMARGFDVTPYYLHVVKYSSKNDQSAVLSGLQFLQRFNVDIPLSMINDLVDILRYRDSQMIGPSEGFDQFNFKKTPRNGSINRKDARMFSSRSSQRVF